MYCAVKVRRHEAMEIYYDHVDAKVECIDIW